MVMHNGAMILMSTICRAALCSVLAAAAVTGQVIGLFYFILFIYFNSSDNTIKQTQATQGRAKVEKKNEKKKNCL